MIVRRTRVAVGTTVLIVLTLSQASAQPSLTGARELYASADYRGALTMLDALLGSTPSPQDRRFIELYRVFCLAAIGSAAEAREAIELMVERDPLFRPNMEDLPPRLRTIFVDARRRRLPTLIQERYVIAKESFDRGDYKNAAEGFTQVLVGLSDPDLETAITQAPLADLRVLVLGFNDLTIKAMTPPAVPVARMTVTVPTLAPTAQAAASSPPSRAVIVPSAAPSRESAARASAARASAAPVIYTPDDSQVAQPMVIRQEVPPFPRKVTMERVGIIEVVIGPAGVVESAAMIQPIDPQYNRLLLSATKNWFYSPARLDGTPVSFRKRIQITLRPTAPSEPR